MILNISLNKLGSRNRLIIFSLALIEMSTIHVVRLGNEGAFTFSLLGKIIFSFAEWTAKHTTRNRVRIRVDQPGTKTTRILQFYYNLFKTKKDLIVS